MGCLKLTYYPHLQLVKSCNRATKPGGKSNAGATPYLYNGKELQEEWDVYDLGFRHYDPALGRFHTVDPLTDLMPGISPYSVSYNNPINYIDYYGLGPLEWWRALKDGVMKALGFQKHGNYKADNVYYTRSRGKKYDPNFKKVEPHKPGERWGPPREPSLNLSFNDNIEIPEPELEFKDVELDLNFLELTKERTNRTFEPELTAGQRFEYEGAVFKGSSDKFGDNIDEFDKFLSDIAQQINASSQYRLKVIVSTNQSKDSQVTSGGKDYYSIMGARGNNIVYRAVNEHGIDFNKIAWDRRSNVKYNAQKKITIEVIK